MNGRAKWEERVTGWSDRKGKMVGRKKRRQKKEENGEKEKRTEKKEVDNKWKGEIGDRMVGGKKNK